MDLSLVDRPFEPSFDQLRSDLIMKMRQNFSFTINPAFGSINEIENLERCARTHVLNPYCVCRKVPVYEVDANGYIMTDEYGQIPDPVKFVETDMSQEEILNNGYNLYKAVYIGTAVTPGLLESIAVIARANDDYVFSKKSFTLQPSRKTETIALIQDQINHIDPETGLIPQNEPFLVRAPSRPTSTEKCTNSLNWESLPPNDPRYIAYRNGQESSSKLYELYALTGMAGKDGQTTLNAFTNNIKSQLDDALRSGKINTEEEAIRLYDVVVKAAIRDKSIFSNPKFTEDGQNVVFADEASWLEFTGNLAKKVLSPILRVLAERKFTEQQTQQRVPQRRQSKKSPYLSAEYARKDGNRQLTDFFQVDTSYNPPRTQIPKPIKRRGRKPKVQDPFQFPSVDDLFKMP